MLDQVNPSSDYTFVGCARIGLISAHWPCAKLRVSPERIELQLMLFGTRVFPRDQVELIEPHRLLGLFPLAIRIRHCVQQYSPRVIFGSWLGSAELLRTLRAAGYICAEVK